MDLESIAAELYGLPPEEFTGARNSRAKALKAGGEADLAAAVQGLRKPTAGAWLLNQLVRLHVDEVERLFELGERLRAAQGTLGAAELRALGERRRQLTRAVAEQAADIGRQAGRAVSAQVVADVEETLRSAMVDADAGAALATGLLVTTFSSTGLEPVDLTGAVAVGGAAGLTSAVAATTGTRAGGHDAADRERQRAEAVVRAQRELDVAERAAEVARVECEAARRQAVEAGRRREDLASELAELRRQVDELERRVHDATEAESAARRDQIAATRAERSALEAVQRARRRLDAAGGGEHV
ncbi:hypothetical protein GA707_10900 [Nostocoides sp. F2B08]|uniref:hypothetical protein n=1 Tax=Nostocoides sp. F2B08 TaxID=2653936 RepID=UPI001263E06E|nr:hypothetical protein [Tetrasphaera sp. F2B08]KAB7743970.1 hypothetical protein GA707_10900 [Tetrasphaera sp. F2B08]